MSSDILKILEYTCKKCVIIRKGNRGSRKETVEIQKKLPV